MTRDQLQSLIDGGGEIVVPAGTSIVVDQPLTIRYGMHLRGNMATLTSPAGTPIFRTDPRVSQYFWTLRDFKLLGGGIGFGVRPVGGTEAPAFFDVENLYIEAAPIAIDTRGSAAWEGAFRRIWATGCGDGFLVSTGTTLLFDRCFAPASKGRAWDVFALYASTFMNCGFDVCAAPLGTPSAHFKACRGLTVSSFYAERNQNPGGALVLFSECDGVSVNGFRTLSSLVTPPPGKWGYVVQIHSTTGVFNGLSTGGAPREDADTMGVSAGAQSVAVLVTGDSEIALAGCTIAPLTRADVSQAALSFIDSGVGRKTQQTACRIGAHLAGGQEAHP